MVYCMYVCTEAGVCMQKTWANIEMWGGDRVKRLFMCLADCTNSGSRTLFVPMATGGAPAATSTVTQEPVVWHPDHASQTPSSVSSPKASRRTSSVASKGTLLHPAATGRKAVEELA